MRQESFEKLIERIVTWVQAEENIRAAVIIGSRARSDIPADEWSDLDLILLSNDPLTYIHNTHWLEQIGPYWLTFTEATPDGRGYERRVLFEGGLDVDFAPAPVSGFLEMLNTTPPPGDMIDLIRRGVRILVDKDNLAEKIERIEIPPYKPDSPSVEEFLNLVHDFWYHTVWTAKHLRRGEIWWAKGCCDGYLKELLRQMLEWQAQVTRPGVDTWMRGRFLEDWVDLRVLSALPDIFAHYDDDDIWKALLATMDLFRWLAIETAEKLGCNYPQTGDNHASELVQFLYEGA